MGRLRNDGWLDMFAAGYQAEDPGDIAAMCLGPPHGAGTPRLYRNNRDGTFRDVPRETGVARPVLTMAANFGDLGDDEYRDIHVVVGTGGSFGSSSLRQEIGLGDAAGIEEIEVGWPASGERQVFRGAGLDRFYRIVEGQGRLDEVRMKRFRLGGEDAAGAASPNRSALPGGGAPSTGSPSLTASPSLAGNPPLTGTR